MTVFQDPAGALQSYAASIIAVLISITSSGCWSAIVAIMAAIVLAIRVYKEIRGLLTTKDGD